MKENIHILLVEDDPLDVELISQALAQTGISYTLDWVKTAAKLRKKLASESIDLVLSDYSVPGYDVREELEWMALNFNQIPVIIVTGTIDEGTAATCLLNGAWDYVLKSNLARLGPAISQALTRREERKSKSGLEQEFRKKAEEHLLLLDHIDLKVWYQSSKNGIGAVNQSFADFWGFEKSALEGTDLESLGQEDGIPALIRGAAEALRTGQALEEEIWLRGKEGEPHLFRVKWTPAGLRSANPYLVCSAQDITRSWEQKEALRRSEERYRRIFENTGTATVSFFDDMIIRMCNLNFERLTGYDRSEILGEMKWTAFIHPDDLPTMVSYHEKRSRGEEAPGEYEFRLIHREGSTKHVFLQITVDQDTHERIASCLDITPIKEYQKQLLGQEAELKALLEYSPIAHIYEDFSGSRAYLNELAEKGVSDLRAYFREHPGEYETCRKKIRIVGLNKAFLELFGLKDKSELENRLFDIVTPESIRMFVEGLIQLVEGAKYYEQQTSYRKPDGSLVQAKTQWLPIPGHEKELDLVAVTIYDMTSQVMATEQERNYQEKLKYLSDNALEVLEIESEEVLFHHTAESIRVLTGAAMIIVSSFDTHTGELNLRSHAGDLLPEMLPDRFREKETGQIRLKVPKEYVREMETGKLMKLQGGLRDLLFGELTEEEERAIMARFAPDEIYGMGFVWGKVLYGCATVVIGKGQETFRPEILEAMLKQTSIALQRIIAQKQSRTLSEAVGHSPVSVIITDPDGIIEYVNPRFCEISGYEALEVIGQKPSILKSGAHDREFYRELWTTIRSGREWRGEFLNRKKNGEFLWELASISSVKNESGEILHFVSVKEDITERKMMEEELRRAKEKAEESDQLKTAFLANLSHEIRTPMNAISGFSELIGSFDIDENARKEYTSIIKSNVSLLSALIDDIIDFSKLESGIMSIENVACDIGSIFSELETYYRHEIRKLGKSVELIFHYEACSRFDFYSDPVRFRQILSNLIGNAIKFTDEGHIEVGCLNAEKGMVTFYVRDTGIGIPEDKFNLIFERFRQADGSATRKYGGTGLGLAISKGLVEVMGGKIWLDSAPGKGSTFYFTLSHEKLDHEGRDLSGQRDKPAVHIPDWSGHTFLVAEDNESNFLVLKAGLRNTGATILWVRTGTDAISLCRDNDDIDLILMDVQMPDMDGLEATRSIKKSHPHMPVIAQTAFSMPEDIEKIIDAGCDDFVSKPIQFKLLIRKIEKHIE